MIKSGFGEELKKTLKTALEKTGVALTNSALNSLSSWLDAAVVPEDDTPTNKFVTHAIAGAGATDVGIAGSVAIALINGETKATIEKVDVADHEWTEGGDVAVEKIKKYLAK